MSFEIGLHVDLRLVRPLRDIGTRVERAIADGLNEGGRKVATQVRRGLWKKTGAIKYKSITERSYMISAKPGALRYQIVVEGKPMNIREFPVRVTSGGVWSSPWATPRTFARSFEMSAAKGKGLLMVRLGSGHLPIRRIRGPNLAKELVGMTRGDRTIPNLFFQTAAQEVPSAIIARLAKALAR